MDLSLVAEEIAIIMEDASLAYVRSMPHDVARIVAPDLPEIDPDVELWALFDGQGGLILLTDNRSSTFFQAAANDLTVMTRH